ncbi:MAG: ribonuclease HII [Cytophagales bacterium]|nr:ribonuclease HII [Cytophagales bacterium]
MLASQFTKDKVEAGLDEVGRGCLAGPVVAAAVILPKDYTHELLNDSKKLSKKARTQLREDIQKDALAYCVAEVSHTKIDEINILNASFLAMHKALDGLNQEPELLLVDGNRFHAYKEIPHTCVVKGDAKFLSIAAASILAKTYRDELMEELAKEYDVYGWESNAGYPTKKHREGIEKYGVSPYHRQSFTLLKDKDNAQLSLFEK